MELVQKNTIFCDLIQFPIVLHCQYIALPYCGVLSMGHMDCSLRQTLIFSAHVFLILLLFNDCVVAYGHIFFRCLNAPAYYSTFPCKMSVLIGWFCHNLCVGVLAKMCNRSKHNLYCKPCPAVVINQYFKDQTNSNEFVV